MQEGILYWHQTNFELFRNIRTSVLKSTRYLKYFVLVVSVTVLSRRVGTRMPPFAINHLAIDPQ